VTIVDRPSPNCEPRPASASIDLLILHYTGMRDGAGALPRLTDPASKVSAHYVIDEDGAIYQLVDEAMRAWHAGAGSWGRIQDLNSHSIGIELIHPGHEWGYRSFAPEQMAALAELSKGILQRHKILARHVLGHSDVAPARKEDPGELFDWAGLAAQGIGLMPPDGLASAVKFQCAPGAMGAEVTALQTALAAYGYACPATGSYDLRTFAAVSAFQRHFRQSCVDGIWDEDCAARLGWLTTQV
jgi:N-acetylmuramoyl-L-alanine amidase